MKISYISWVFLLFILWRLVLSLGFFLGTSVLPFRPDFTSIKLYPHAPLWLASWANFDGAHYLHIARNGYAFGQQAFFPLYPFFIGVVKNLTFDHHLYAAFLISNLSFLASLIVAHKLFNLDFNHKQTKVAIIFLTFFPTSFFFGSVYSESLFLLFSLSTFLALRRKGWLLASFFGGLASLTRFVGIFLLPAFLWEWWKNKEKFKNKKEKFLSLASSILIPSGLVLYMVYLKQTVGDPLAFIHLQPEFGAQRTGGEIILLPQVIFRYFKIFIFSQVNYQYLIALLEFFSLIFALLVLIFLWFKKLPRSYLIFAILAILAPTLTGTLSSMPRYILAAFPLFLLPVFLENNFLNFLIIALSFTILLVLTALFTRGFWIA